VLAGRGIAPPLLELEDEEDEEDCESGGRGGAAPIRRGTPGALTHDLELLAFELSPERRPSGSGRQGGRDDTAAVLGRWRRGCRVLAGAGDDADNKRL